MLTTILLLSIHDNDDDDDGDDDEDDDDDDDDDDDEGDDAADDDGDGDGDFGARRIYDRGRSNWFVLDLLPIADCHASLGSNKSMMVMMMRVMMITMTGGSVRTSKNPSKVLVK